MSAKKVEKSANSTFAYTPGLKMKDQELIIKDRMLPVTGEVMLKEGDTVSYDTIVAKTLVKGMPHISRTASTLGVDPEELEDYMIKKIGDQIEKGELLGKYSGFFGWFDRKCNARVSGTIESISRVTGCVVIREPDILVNIEAYIPGNVVEVFPGEGVRIECNSAFIQGIFGVGGEIHGKLKICVESNEAILTENDIDESCKGKIVLGGSKITKDALHKAVEVGAAGLIAGGMNDKDLMDYLGYEIGVAITGHEDIPLSIILTEGFGEIPMSRRTFALLKKYEGSMVSATGETQIRAGVMRPEIIIPHEVFDETKEDLEDKLVGGMSIETLVRVIREPYFGLIGKIADLPVQLQKIQTGSSVRVMELELEDGRTVTVPRANVEIIEE